MRTPDYIKILKLDKLAMKSKTHAAFLNLAESKVPNAKRLGVEASFSYFVDEAWKEFGDGN
jgi:hypothetical protein